MCVCVHISMISVCKTKLIIRSTALFGVCETKSHQAKAIHIVDYINIFERSIFPRKEHMFQTISLAALIYILIRFVFLRFSLKYCSIVHFQENNKTHTHTQVKSNEISSLRMQVGKIIAKVPQSDCKLR